MGNINLKQLEVFAAVVECGSFTEAANQLYMAQSTVSSHIHALEAILLTPLFHRGAKKNGALTDDGKRGYQLAKDVLEKAFGQQQATSFMERLSKSLRSKSFEFVRKADAKNIQMILQNEHPQTIALILSYARSDQAAQIIAELPRSIQLDVIKRIAELDRVSPEMIKLVEATLEKRFSSIVSSDQIEVGGVSYIAEIMNRVDRATEKYIFDELGEKDAALAEEIHKLMFVFEDIANLDSMSVQRFIREVDTKDLAVALKSANENVKQLILQNMSSRMRESVEQDIQFLHNIRMKDVEEAQQKIVGVIRQLEETGEIVIARGEGDEILA